MSKELLCAIMANMHAAALIAAMQQITITSETDLWLYELHAMQRYLNHLIALEAARLELTHDSAGHQPSL